MTMSLPVYYLYCSVCEGGFYTPKEWNKHLTQSDHRNLTRKELLQECSNNNWDRECCLVIFSSHPFTKKRANGVIDYFSKQTTFVTDFVWWEDRPRIGVLQFESREKVEDAVGSADFLELWIGSELIQSKRALDLLDLEWSSILPGNFTCQNHGRTSQVNGNVDTLPTPDVNEFDDHDDEHQQVETESEAVDQQNQELYLERDDNEVDGPVYRLHQLALQRQWDPPKFTVQKLDADNVKRFICHVKLNRVNYKPTTNLAAAKTKKKAKVNAAQFCLDTLGSQSNLKSNDHDQNGNIAAPLLAKQSCGVVDQSLFSLHHQFKPIRELVEIPDDEYKKAIHIVNIFRDLVTRSNPSVRVVIFRNWYLKLKNAVSDELFIYVYSSTPPLPSLDKAQGNFTWVPGVTIRNDVNTKKQLFTWDPYFPRADNARETRLGCEFTHIETGFRFNVVNHKRLIVEVQMCRLVKYLSEFNIRVRSLFSLVHYWTIVNNLRIGEEFVPPISIHQHLPDPCTLEWLVLTFLMQGKHIPSVREILARPHEQLIERVIDIGFHEDLQFANSWSIKKGKQKYVRDQSTDEFLLSVLHLFRDFLTFCQKTIVKGGVILNTKDGEILDKAKFLEEPNDVITKLTPQEIALLVQQQKNYDNKINGQVPNDNDNEGPRNCVNFASWHFYMIHPLIVEWRFSISRGFADQVREAIIITTTKFQEFLNFASYENGLEKAFVKFGALEDILKIDRSSGSTNGKRRLESELQSETETYLHKKKSKIEDSLPTTEEHENAAPLDGGTGIPSASIDNLLNVITASSQSLQYQFWSLRNSVIIPSVEYNRAKQVEESLKKVFLFNDPTVKVIMFRHWHLKLRIPHSNDNELLFYVYSTRSHPDFPNSFTWLPDTVVAQSFNHPSAKKLFTVPEVPQTDFVQNDYDMQEQQPGWRMKYTPNGLTSCIVTLKRFIVEAQICRLLEYMCTFENRCHPLLTLAYFWTSANAVSFGDPEINLLNINYSLPDPHTMQWLVIHFLCHQKYIPTPREIQKRPHQVLKEGLLGVDIGFHADPEFVKEWNSSKEHTPEIPSGDTSSTEEFIVSVLRLFLEFLQFCGSTLESGNFILNTRDGEVIPIERFLACAPGGDNGTFSWTTKMSEDELAMLRGLQANFPTSAVASDNTSTSTPYRVRFKDWKLYMTNPFICQWKFSMLKDVRFILKLLKSTEIQLRKFLNARKNNGVKTAEKQFGNLENVLTVNERIRNKISSQVLT